MAKNKPTNSFLPAFFNQLGWPLFWGGAMTVGFYALLEKGIIFPNPSVKRYFNAHWVEYIETAMFFVGLAALGLHALNICRQCLGVDQIALPTAPAGGQHVEDCPKLLESLSRVPARMKEWYIVRRLRSALEAVNRKGSSEGLGDELKFLSDTDAVRMHDAYGLVRILIWATPMMGFLGTVLGITEALGDLSPEALVNTPKEAMDGLLGGLSIAFDTTALALILAMLMMFVQFGIERFEGQLISTVDDKSAEQLIGRFQEIGGAAGDPNVASIRRMCDTVVRTTEELVHRQAEIWNGAAAQTGASLEQALVNSLKTALAGHAQEVQKAELAAADRHLQGIDRFESALGKHAGRLAVQDEALHRQGELLLKITQASGEVLKLEKTLNDNLRALSGAKHFEDTVVSLAAAIQLLGARLGSTNDIALVDLNSNKKQGRSAA